MESFPITLLEASSHGLALISSSLFGAKEMVIPGVNGFLFEAANSSSLRSALGNFCSSDLDKLKSNSRTLLDIWPDEEHYRISLLNIVKTVGQS